MTIEIKHVNDPENHNIEDLSVFRTANLSINWVAFPAVSINVKNGLAHTHPNPNLDFSRFANKTLVYYQVSAITVQR